MLPFAAEGRGCVRLDSHREHCLLREAEVVHRMRAYVVRALRIHEVDPHEIEPQACRHVEWPVFPRFAPDVRHLGAARDLMPPTPYAVAVSINRRGPLQAIRFLYGFRALAHLHHENYQRDHYRKRTQKLS